MKTNLRIIQPTVAATLAIVIACVISVRPAQAGYMVTLQEVGSNVIATGTGAIDLTGLTFSVNTGGTAGVVSSLGVILTGPTVSSISIYTGVSGPTSFGSGGETFASSGTGDFVGIIGANGTLIVPLGYMSGTALSDSSTYDSATFSSLGVTPGIYEWTWGTGGNQNFTLDAVAPAVPNSGSTFALLFLSLIAISGATRLRSLRVA